MNLLVPPPVTCGYHPKALQLLDLLHVLLFTCSVHWLGFLETLERHNSSVVLVLNFIPAWSHAAGNWSSACWRPCSEDASITNRKKQTVDPATPNSDTLADSAETVYPIHIDQGFLTGGKFPTSRKFHPCSGKFWFGAVRNCFTPIPKEGNLNIKSQTYFLKKHLLVN